MIQNIYDQVQDEFILEVKNENKNKLSNRWLILGQILFPNKHNLELFRGKSRKVLIDQKLQNHRNEPDNKKDFIHKEENDKTNDNQYQPAK